MGRYLLTAVCVAAIAGCATWRQPVALPTASSLQFGQLVIYSDFSLPPEHRLFAELHELRGRISEQLAVPAGSDPIEVYLFQTPRSYQTFMRAHHPDLPQRRALFVETDNHLRVYAAWGDRVAEDLRHEVSHGYFHSMLPELPLWLDEGLAEYFEVQAEQQGLNRPHVEHLQAAMRSGAWRPNLSRLASIQSAEGMRQTEYAESWLWAHWLLHSTPENRELVRGYLGALRERRSTEPLEKALLAQNPDAARELILHLERLAGKESQNDDARMTKE